jgi:ribonuclease P protein component
VTASPLAHPRVGIIVPRYRHSAVDRNRLKRQLREIVRLHMLPAVGPLDIVIRTRAEAYDARFEELANELARVRARLDEPRRE